MSNEQNEIPEVQTLHEIHGLNLYIPYPEIIINEVRKELEKNFTVVSIGYRPIIDLTIYKLVSRGLSRNTAIMQIGSLQYLFPRPQLHKKYCLRNLLLQLNRVHHRNFIIGAGMHSNPPLYDLADLSTNILFEQFYNVRNGMRNKNQSKTIWWNESRNLVNYTDVHDTTCLIQGNFFLSEGMPGNVFSIMAVNRYGAYDFATSIQRALSMVQNHYYTQPIGLGGMFLSTNAIHHNLPSSSAFNISTVEQAQQWLKYNKLCEVSINIGTIMGDIFMKNRLYKYYNSAVYNTHITKVHFHTITKNGKGGHLYTNDRIQQCATVNLGFFSVAEKYYVVDCPWSIVTPELNEPIMNEFYLPERIF